jgi:hypothetical protein
MSDASSFSAPTAGEEPGVRSVETRMNEHLTALLRLLAEADVPIAGIECRDGRTGALVAYSFATIHRGLALQLSEAVRAGLARLEADSTVVKRARFSPDDRHPELSSTPGHEQLPGQYL